MTITPSTYGYVKLHPPKVSKVFNTYWKFAAKRQEAFFARIYGKNSPWTDDPIIMNYKFTNAYRASDRVSQYLINNVIYSKNWSLEDTVFRVLLFKLFNKMETWELLESQLGEISLRTFHVDKYELILEKAMSGGGAIYSAAYIIPSGSKSKYKGIRKHRFHLLLLEKLIKEGLPDLLSNQKTMKLGFECLLNIESFGKFLAYQFITDLNYSEWFQYSESEFVVPGPGALDGIRKCFTNLGDYKEAEIIRMMFEEQNHHFESLGHEFKSLWGRPLQLIDCQNLFCEVDKYSRVAHPSIKGISGRTRIKQKFNPKPEPIQVWYPPKWEINEKILLGL